MSNRRPTYDELHMIPIFDEVDGRDFIWLGKSTEVHSFGNGAEIFKEGAPGDAMYFILEGEVDIIKRSIDNKPVHLATLPKGTVFGEMSLVDSAPRSAAAIAKTPSQLIVLKKHSFFRLVEDHPRPACKILMKLMRTLSMRLRLVDSKFVDKE